MFLTLGLRFILSLFISLFILFLPLPSAAHTLESTKMAGTLQYMSPEMVTHKPVAPNTDVWSLGICAIEIATGRLPRGDLHQMKVGPSTI